MYVVKFERYWNDYRRKDETKTFLGLAELENWMFGQMQQDYTCLLYTSDAADEL